jgi:threonine synthase
MPFDLSQFQKRQSFILCCFACKKEYNIDDYGKFYQCLNCGNLLEVRQIARAKKTLPNTKLSKLGVWRYIDMIPLWNEVFMVTLSEGGTNLIECKNLASMLGLASLYVKFEGLNPTGSFKDRGMTVGVSKAKELGYTSVICASTGNTSASLAAYSARAGFRCIVLVPKGKIAMGKLAQTIAYGAEIFQVEGNFDDSLRVAREICERNSKIFLLNSLNPFRIEGQKTASFEIVEQLGRVPDYMVLPVGNGGNISATWKGFSEIFEDDSGAVLPRSYFGGKPPRMIGVQAEGAAPIARAYKAGRRDSIDAVANPQTEASAINIGSPVSWMKALAAIYDSGGKADFVSDEEIFSAQRLIASKEGLFVEPASATPLAYLAKVSRERTSREFEDLREATVVCICTGNGLKDSNALLKGVSPERIKTISAEAKSLERVLA